MLNLVMDNLSDEEIKQLARKISVSELIGPIRRNKKTYANYVSQLGSLDARSAAVKVKAPLIATRLFKNEDAAYIEIFRKNAEGIVKTFEEAVSEIDEFKEITNEQLGKVAPEELANMVNALCDSSGTEINEFDFDFLWLILSLLGRSVDENSREKVLKLLDIWEESESKEEETLHMDDDDGQRPKVGKKPKKKTAEEKKAANKAALERKKLEQMAEQEREKKERKADSNMVADGEIKIATRKTEENGNVKTADVPKEEPTNIYLGKMDIINTHYNFVPMYVKTNLGKWNKLDDATLRTLLPDSTIQNVEFVYNINDDSQREEMEKRFQEGTLTIFEFETDELLDNIDPYGNLKQTAYMVRYNEAMNQKKIRFLHEEGLYQIIDGDTLEENIYTHRSVKLDSSKYIEKESILIGLEDGFAAGPYEVVTQSESLFIVPNVAAKKYVLYGYAIENCKKHYFFYDRVWSSSKSWELYSISFDAERICRDVMQDDVLAKIYYDSTKKIENDEDEDIKIQAETLLYGNDIPDEIREQRAERLKAVIGSIEKTSDINEDQINSIYNLFINNKDDDRISAIIGNVIEKHPDFLNKISSIKAIQDRKEREQQNLEQIKNDADEARQWKELSHSTKAGYEEFEELTEKIQAAKTLEGLNKDIAKAKQTIEELSEQEKHLSDSTGILRDKFEELISNYSEKIVDVSFDGFMSSKMLQAASKWEQNSSDEAFLKAVDTINTLSTDFDNSDELIDYIVNTVQIERPQYDHNTIVNILTCLTQGFLTVFSGAPGSGKTSICNIIARTLGLTSFTHAVGNVMGIENANRFVAVSVERGWTSKRDFIGYYNPLTKMYEDSNKEVFNGLRMLDIESRQGLEEFPFYILLDEANLSPMEYYWADFMNVCDDPESEHNINLGNDMILNIPETLHFAATINNDNTTEELSPRLIDRAWVITLPKSASSYGDRIQDKEIRIVPWELLKETFSVLPDEKPRITGEAGIVYEAVRKHLRGEGYEISPRVDIAIKNYYAIASEIMMEDNLGNSPEIIALDYAIMQKILPKIMGSGDRFKEWLVEFEELCSSHNLLQSKDALNNIIRIGENKNMGFYKFF